VVRARPAAGPVGPSAVKVAGLPVIPDAAAVAVSVFVPVVVPSVQEAAAAIPFAPVATAVVGSTVPLPDATWKVTATPCTGLPLASCTITDGGELTALPAGADCVVGLFAAITAAAPALSVIAAMAGVSPGAPKLSVSLPTVPVNVRPLNVADPFDPVVAVALLGVAPAGLSVAVTTTPLWLTGLPLASSSCSTGCWANATPLCAALDGGVVKASRAAAPTVPLAVHVTGL